MADFSKLATGRIEIDLGALTRNYRLLQSQAAPAACAATVKADGYGHGIENIMPPLVAAGCTIFFVATPLEGIAARTLASDVEIYVLDGLMPDATETYLEHRLKPVLGDIDEYREWGRTAAGAPAALHVDTGMNRLGLSPNELQILHTEGAGSDSPTIDLLMTHLACADTPDHPLNREQRAAFDAVRVLFPGVRASLGNSAATLDGVSKAYDLARPGVALYGGRSLVDTDKKTEPVARVFARILKIRDNWAGTTVGYGASRSTANCQRIAPLAIGYADGLLRHLSAADGETEANVWCANRAVPIIGRVSMDLITIDVSAIPVEEVSRGDMVEIFGTHIAVDSLADRANTIGYELLTQLSRRLPRVILPMGETT